MDSLSLSRLLKTPRRVHFIGVGGTGMSGAARILKARGHRVSGSDAQDGPSLAMLRKEGIQVYPGSLPEQFQESIDVVVISAAVPGENGERLAAKRRNIPEVKYAVLLGALISGRKGIAVAGTHGKTTTASMIAWGLHAAGREPGFLIGGEVPQFGTNAREGDSGVFIAEACEFDRSFLNLRPDLAVITNVESDHLDYYHDLHEIEEAFSEFANRVRPGGILVLGKELFPRLKISPYAEIIRLGEDVQWKVLGHELGRYRFSVLGEGLESAGVFSLRVPGAFNVENAVASAVVLVRMGIAPGDVREHLSRYAGASRRFTLLGEKNGITVIDDYGHHPREIEVVLDAVRKSHPGRRILLVFQPHQASRTRLFFRNFVRSLSAADKIVLPPIFRARDSDRDWFSISSRLLADVLREDGKDAASFGSFDEILLHLEETARPGDVLLTMGAGNVYEIARQFLSLGGAEAGSSAGVHHA